jgi:hypothetical protein
VRVVGHPHQELVTEGGQYDAGGLRALAGLVADLPGEVTRSDPTLGSVPAPHPPHRGLTRWRQALAAATVRLAVDREGDLAVDLAGERRRLSRA